jgi:hypothetical protein
MNCEISSKRSGSREIGSRQRHVTSHRRAQAWAKQYPPVRIEGAVPASDQLSSLSCASQVALFPQSFEPSAGDGCRHWLVRVLGEAPQVANLARARGDCAVMFAVRIPWWRWVYPAIERVLLRATVGALRAGVGRHARLRTAGLDVTAARLLCANPGALLLPAISQPCIRADLPDVRHGGVAATSQPRRWSGSEPDDRNHILLQLGCQSV